MFFTYCGIVSDESPVCVWIDLCCTLLSNSLSFTRSKLWCRVLLFMHICYHLNNNSDLIRLIIYCWFLIWLVCLIGSPIPRPIAQSADRKDSDLSEDEKLPEERMIEQMTRDLPQGSDKVPFLDEWLAGVPDRYVNWITPLGNMVHMLRRLLISYLKLSVFYIHNRSIFQFSNNHDMKGR